MLLLSFKIERFDKKIHRRNQFECEELALTHYVKNQLTQDEKRGLSKAFVLYREDDLEKNIQGFYTLSAFSVNLNSDSVHKYKAQTEHKAFAKIPVSVPTPGMLIGRLARHLELKGTEAGTALLSHALHTIFELENQFGIHFVIVDAKNEIVKVFYRKFGFLEFGSVPDRMYLPVKTISFVLKNIA